MGKWAKMYRTLPQSQQQQHEDQVVGSGESKLQIRKTHLQKDFKMISNQEVRIRLVGEKNKNLVWRQAHSPD